MLSVSDYSVAYGQSEVIRRLNLAVKDNEIVAVVGRNGMGKTTLMKSLVGMLPVRHGRIELNGQDLTALKSHQRVRAGLGFVPQGRMVFPTLTVKENIETGLPAAGKGAAGRGVSEDLYELFPVLKEMQGRRGGNLSGGQQQQLAIARALATGPSVLLLDEPTEGIQPSIIQEIARTLKRIRDERGLSIVVSEQVLSFVLEIADRVLVIEKGELVHEQERGAFDEQRIASYLSV
ncbi:urea ABC transporter ATP-binding subunit UrtE [Alloalcanivorax mobilis]|uniref:urea ABC transporter ATP-binding subunit UrtE n=1 Tax=Alloalcanivorax mobilis TaxID=2019569 RepID=UPI000B5B1A13|nr:urea ABC transporter ATP-binding subunit UrtE [Alloalcanivorax mobilis]ASK33075.1 urea ABC transporter ATP-binding subunit UrtE [Alcanivorax sp. N3-2A]ASK36893.1 urea ABC transporter ATP-binding subunit UrtE [Alcanivorax sp. N3-2A]|tara:strand:+ start:4342 stop:5043 length:702 start_codon:yes stop_codon:yes gene_type:complete